MTRLTGWSWGGAGASSHGLRLVLNTLAAACLFTLAYPPWNLGVITAWFAFVPLIAVAGHASPARAALAGWCFGLLSYLAIFSWIIQVPGMRWHHIALLDAYLSLYPALWTLLVALSLRDSFRTHFFLACSWVLLEYVRSHAGFLAFPWITLAQSQVDNTPLLQAASLFGEGAVSGMVTLGNFAIWSVLRGKARLALLSGVPLAIAAVIGAPVEWEFRAPTGPTLNVAALGTAFSASSTARPDPLIRLESQLDFLREHPPDGAALIVLPESAVVNPQLFPEQVALFNRWAIGPRRAFVVGVAQATKFDQPPLPYDSDAPQLRSEAWVFTGTQNDPLRHVKSQLVPFAETRPLKSWLHWPEWLVPLRPEVVRGPSPRSLPIKDDIRVGIMICWESFFAHHAKALVDDDAMLLIMLANEGWFGGGPAGAQHNLTARIRAVEFRRSVVVSSNMGPPLVVNPYGQVLDSGSLNPAMQWSRATIPILSEQSWYSRLGDALPLGCVLLLASYAISALSRTRRLAAVRLTPATADHLPAPPMVMKGGSRPPANEPRR